MALPSDIPSYGNVDLPDFDRLESTIPGPPKGRLRAWAKFAETDRRMTVFDWAVWALAKGGLPVFMQDLATAYLLSFETTLEFLKDERRDSRRNFERWLSGRAAYDLECRGLRTLRHLEAHIRSGTISAQVGAVADSRFGGPTPAGRSTWFWDAITLADLNALRAPALGTDELDAWNSRSHSVPVRGLMIHGLERLRTILKEAE
jgi:hypothetical protein